MSDIYIQPGGGGSGSGTVTTVSVATANGFAGTVANATSTPAITMKTTITGVLKGNGTAVTAAVGDTDYQNPISLTTTGASGAATFSGDVLNIPEYAIGTGTGLVIGLPFFMQTGANITIQLDAYAAFGYTITTIGGIATTSGTITANFAIGGTSLTGASAIAVTSTPANVTPSANNVVVATNQLTVTLTSNAAALGLCFTLSMTRT